MSRHLLNSALIVLACAYGAVSVTAAPAPNLPTNCAGDRSLQACVASAALTGNEIIHDGGQDLHVIVSVTLELFNSTEYPLDVAFVAEESKWSFTPVNSESVVPGLRIMGARDLNFAGATTCSRNYGREECRFTSLAPGQKYRVQVTWSGRLTRNALPLTQIATKASLSGLLSIMERGQQRYVPLPVPEFSFGNGVANLR